MMQDVAVGTPVTTAIYIANLPHGWLQNAAKFLEQEEKLNYQIPHLILNSLSV
jgi:hypothetical protein